MDLKIKVSKFGAKNGTFLPKNVTFFQKTHLKGSYVRKTNNLGQKGDVFCPALMAPTICWSI